jgi:hypothetical protein
MLLDSKLKVSLDLRFFTVVTEEFYLLGYDVMQSSESQAMFWRNTPLPSSGLKTTKKPA